MKIVGYKYREIPNDWVRPYPGGRFHAKMEEKDLMNFHFDIFTDDKHHFSIRLPILEVREKIRIISLLRRRGVKYIKSKPYERLRNTKI